MAHGQHYNEHPNYYYHPSSAPVAAPPYYYVQASVHQHNAANSSYWFGNDSVGGWGQRYFFTFYTEGGERRPWAILEASVFAVVFLVSVLANVSIAAAVLRYREMRTVTNCFLLNLAAADLVFAMGSPLVAAARLTEDWPLGDTACRLLPYSQVRLPQGRGQAFGPVLGGGLKPRPGPSCIPSPGRVQTLRGRETNLPILSIREARGGA